MFPYKNYCHDLERTSKTNSMVEEPESMKRPETGGGKPGLGSLKQKSQKAAKKHALAERLRRSRINAHIETLRRLLIPNITAKASVTMKASVLKETIRQVKELRKRASDAALSWDGQGWCSGDDMLGTFMFPNERNEATVISYCEGGEGKKVKATVCCEDKPGLNRDLCEAIRSVGARVVRVEMTTIGGRTKAEVVVQWRQVRDGCGGAVEDVRSLTRALKGLVESQATTCSSLGHIMEVNMQTGLGLEIPTNTGLGCIVRSTEMGNGKSFYSV